jgi:hypothetical protein
MMKHPFPAPQGFSGLSSRGFRQAEAYRRSSVGSSRGNPEIERWSLPSRCAPAGKRSVSKGDLRRKNRVAQKKLINSEFYILLSHPKVVALGKRQKDEV